MAILVIGRAANALILGLDHGNVAGTSCRFRPGVPCRPNVPFPPRRFTTASSAVGCKRLLGGESERKILSMTKAAEALLADALRLHPDARAELAAELLASLAGPEDPDADAAWNVEIERRVAAIEAGTVRLEPWDNVKRRIEKEILGR